jgi:hypothetical protein
MKLPLPSVRSLTSRASGAAALLAVAGCGLLGKGGPDPVALRGTVLTDTTSLAVPTDLLVDEGKLVVHDTRGANVVRVFDLQGRAVAEAGREGSGPSEFVDPMGVARRPGRPGEFWVYDGRLARLTPFKVSELAGGRTASAAPLRLSSGLVIETPLWLDDTTVVALNPMIKTGEGRFVIFGPDGVARGTVGDPPPGDTRTLTPFIRQQLYGGRMAAHPTRPEFVVASHYAGRLEVYGRDGKLVRGFQVPDAFEPDVRPAPDHVNFLPNDGFRVGYVDVAVTADRIYALFSGRLDKDEGDAFFGDQVQVFDWQGNLLQVLKLDSSVLRIALDPQAATLYAVRHDPYPQVVSYRLSDAPSSAD